MNAPRDLSPLPDPPLGKTPDKPVTKRGGTRERLMFLREYMAEPSRVAAVAPSSRALAAMMTRDLDPRSAPVIELGPGTGVFTQAILARGVPESRLAMVEAGTRFADQLRERFPAARVLTMDAAALRTVTPFGDEKVGAVVSGLPLLSMSPRGVYGVLAGVRRHLRAGGGFYQFTYSWRCPAPKRFLARLGLRAALFGHVFANLPPASVYKFTIDDRDPGPGRDARPA